MSTILDALKKSEQERKRNNVPTLSDMPTPQESSRWPWVAIAILSLVLALVVGVLLNQWLSAPKQAAAVNETVVQSQPTPVGTSASASNPVGITPQVDADLDTVGNDAAVIVNVVSYSEVPEQRFVMLDGKMYRENDFVRAGLRVEEIKPNAVVLNVRGELITRTP